MISFEKAMAYINSFDRLGQPVSDLNRIEALLSLLDNPQKSLRFIHIAGTNGKGSVAQMCNDILLHAGYRVGLFTSPYITEYTDRIRCDGKNISHEMLCEIINEIKAVVDTLPYKSAFSQFEISTVIALMYFKRTRCDIVVLETGIGGLLDSTNVVENKVVTIITSISYDHTKILGNTLEKIAFQKAGIIRKHVPCILSANNAPEVVKTVSEQCDNNGSELIIPQYDKVRVFKSDIYGNEFYYGGSDYRTRLCGTHQIINAITVIEAMKIVEKSGFSVSYNDVSEGLKNAKILARAEILSKSPLVILDGAHNPAGMRSICQIVSGIKCSRHIAVIGMTKEKDAESTIKEIIPFFNDFICVDDFGKNAYNADILAKMLRGYKKNAVSIYDLKLAVSEAREMVGDNGLLLICGSLYLASEVRKFLV